MKNCEGCIACPEEVRDLFACAHNVVVNRDNPRLQKKLDELKRAVDRIQPIIDKHFGD